MFVCFVCLIWFFIVVSKMHLLPQNALKRDCNGKCIDKIEGHHLEVVVLL